MATSTRFTFKKIPGTGWDVTRIADGTHIGRIYRGGENDWTAFFPDGEHVKDAYLTTRGRDTMASVLSIAWDWQGKGA